MTLAELRHACAASRARAADNGIDPDDSHLILVVPGKMDRPGQRKRVLGALGTIVGETDGGVIVDCKVVDLELGMKRYLARKR